MKVKRFFYSVLLILFSLVLLADLGMNSFDMVNLVCVVEDEFEIEIPDRVIGTFKTVGDVIDFIEKQ